MTHPFHICNMIFVWRLYIAYVTWFQISLLQTHPFHYVTHPYLVYNMTHLCDAYTSHMWHDEYTWLYDSSISYICHDALYMTLVYHICDVTHAHDYMTHPYHIYDMTHLHMTYIDHTCDMTHHMSIWLIHITYMTMWLIHITSMTWLIDMTHVYHICDVTHAHDYMTHSYDMTHVYEACISHMWRDAGTWLYDWHDSFIWSLYITYVTWRRHMTTWLIYMKSVYHICDVTQAHDYMTHSYDMTHLYEACISHMWRDSCTWLHISSLSYI